MSSTGNEKKNSISDVWRDSEYASAAKQGRCKVCKNNSRRRYVKYKSTCVFWSISMILASVWLCNVRFENLWSSYVEQRFCSTILKVRLALSFWFLLVGYLLLLNWYSNWDKNKTSVILEPYSEAYSKPWQTSQIEVFTKIVKGFSFLTIFAKTSILDVWQDSEFPCKLGKDLWKSSISDVKQGLEFTLVLIIFARLAYLFNKFD